MEEVKKGKLPCLVCGELYLDDTYSFEICPVCGWLEDGYQQKYPDDTGANLQWTLNKAKEAWAQGEALYPKYHPHP